MSCAHCTSVTWTPSTPHVFRNIFHVHKALHKLLTFPLPRKGHLGHPGERPQVWHGEWGWPKMGLARARRDQESLKPESSWKSGDTGEGTRPFPGQEMRIPASLIQVWRGRLTSGGIWVATSLHFHALHLSGPEQSPTTHHGAHRCLPLVTVPTFCGGALPKENSGSHSKLFPQHDSMWLSNRYGYHNVPKLASLSSIVQTPHPPIRPPQPHGQSSLHTKFWFF